MDKKIKIKEAFLKWLLLLLGISAWFLIMGRSGRSYPWGIGFWGPNGHDAIWHLSLINQIGKGLPPGNPVFAGEVLQNYHWGFDLFAALVKKITPFSLLDLYFRVFPLLFSFLIGIFSFSLAKKVTGKFWVGFWFAFLNFFAGSFGWIVTLLREGKIGGESLFWSMQSISTLINPPYALSLVILLFGLFLWEGKRREGKIIWAILIGMVFGLIALVKVYGAVVIGLSLFVFFLFSLKEKKENLRFDFFVLASAGIVSFILLFLMGVFSSRSALVFEPFWFVHSLVESLDKLYLPRLAALRINLAAQALSWKLPFLFGLEFFFLALFLFGNLGTRAVGLANIFKKIKEKKMDQFDRLFFPFLFFSLILPLLFVQKGTTWNTIQFFYYFLFGVNFYAASFVASMTEKGSGKRAEKTLGKRGLFLILFVVFTLPTTISSLRGYWGNPSPATLPFAEKEGVDFLKSKPPGTVLVFPYDSFKRGGRSAPLPLYLYETSAYVSAFSEKQTFLEDEMNLEITGFPWRERRREAEEFFFGDDVFRSRGFLLNNGIDYIYLVDDQFLPLPAADLGVEMIFENEQVRIYRVLK